MFFLIHFVNFTFPIMYNSIDFVFRYLTTCRQCPNKYPWLGDSKGTGIAGTDVYNPENRRRR